MAESGSFPMNGGTGTYSYANNSQYQKRGSDHAKEMIQDAIVGKLGTQTLTSASNTFRIVDLGCSVGPNTFFTIQNIIEALETKCLSHGLDQKSLELQVFFNDHASNDFNTLFASLPLGRRYYASGVPGSFYGRLFPRSSICLAHSSFALQWLSRVPEALLVKGSTAWNEGRIHCAGAKAEVINAYADQFERDMGVFLSARAEEIVRGGLMVVIMPALPDGVCHSQASIGIMFNFLGSSLMDMANEGIIDKAEIDSFNLPIYAPKVGEMTRMIEKNGCFSIERIELTDPILSSRTTGSPNVQSIIMSLRAGMEGVFAKHFGHEVTEEMFSRTLAKSEEIIDFFRSGAYHASPQLFVALKRYMI